MDPRSRLSIRQTLESVEGCEAVVTKTASEKQTFVESIGSDVTVAIGNGNIDLKMFEVAALAICAVQAEGASSKALLVADIVVTDIIHAFEILLDAEKLIATLRA